MNDASKVNPSHIQRAAFVYVRQSSPAQVESNRESTARQYALVVKACQLGWAKEQVTVIDEDLGVSGSGFAERSGFARLTAEVALGHVGIVSSQYLVSMRRYAIVAVTGIAAILTPPDLISMTSLALPMLLLYEGSVIAVRMVEKRREAADKAKAKT